MTARTSPCRSRSTQLRPPRTAAPGVPIVPRLSAPTMWWLQVMGRLKPGVTAAQVHANLATVFQHTARAGFDSFIASLAGDHAIELALPEPHRGAAAASSILAHAGIYDVSTSDERSVTILGVVVVLVLLIVCANVANLLLSRATTRQKEISIRLSLGATRGRLIRQLLTESLLLASVGGALGILVAKWSGQLLPGAAGQATAIDWRVLSFVLGVTVVTGIVFGIAPALRATSMNVSATLKETSRSVAGSRSLLTKGLLVLQVAVSLVLLIAAGLFLRTLNNLRNVDVGFNTQNLVLFRVNPSLNRYDDAKTATLVEQITARLEAIPGVRAVAVSNVPLLSNSTNSTSFFRQGRSTHPQFDSINVLHDLSRLLQDDGDAARQRPRLHGSRQPDGAEGRRDQRNRGAEVLPERESARPAFRHERRAEQTDRGRRRAARRQIRQRPQRDSADDVRAAPAGAAGDDVPGAHGGRSGDGDRRDPRGGAADRSGSADDGRRHAGRSRSTRTCSRSACSRRPTRCSAGSRC